MSLLAYQEIKPSGIEYSGEIPSEWSLKRLGDLVAFAQGKAHEPYIDDDGDYICVNSRFVSTSGKTIKTCSVNLTPASLNDILMVMSDLPNGRALARAYYVDDYGKYAVNQRVCRITAEKAHSRFLFYLLDRHPGLMQNDDGVHQTHLSNSDFQKLKLYLPSLSEQNQIARFLDHETARIDALIEVQQRLIELLKEKRQAMISHAITKGLDPTVPMKDSGVEWLGEVPAHWDVSRLKYHSTRIGDGLHSTPEYDDAGDYFFINGNNLAEGAITISPTTRQVNRQEFLKHRVLLDSSTVLISINGTIGNLALYSGEPVILGKSAAYINCTESLSPRFCLYLFSSGQIKRFFESQLTGTTIYNLSLRTIAETPTPLPSIDEQNSIVEFLNRNVDGFDELIDNAMKLAQLLEERRSALISAAVTGKIDVRGWQPPVSVSSPVLEAEAV